MKRCGGGRSLWTKWRRHWAPYLHFPLKPNSTYSPFPTRASCAGRGAAASRCFCCAALCPGWTDSLAALQTAGSRRPSICPASSRAASDVGSAACVKTKKKGHNPGADIPNKKVILLLLRFRWRFAGRVGWWVAVMAHEDEKSWHRMAGG